MLTFYEEAEQIFRGVRGVQEIRTGYAGGHIRNPSQLDVMLGTSGHAECVAVSFDPTISSFVALLALFWETLGQKSFNQTQVESQHRSAIFCLNATQLEAANKSRADLNARLGRRVILDIMQIERSDFYIA